MQTPCIVFLHCLACADNMNVLLGPCCRCQPGLLQLSCIEDLYFQVCCKAGIYAHMVITIPAHQHYDRARPPRAGAPQEQVCACVRVCVCSCLWGCTYATSSGANKSTVDCCCRPILVTATAAGWCTSSVTPRYAPCAAFENSDGFVSREIVGVFNVDASLDCYRTCLARCCSAACSLLSTMMRVGRSPLCLCSALLIIACGASLCCRPPRSALHSALRACCCV